MGAGARGVTCATVGEVEVMAKAGVEDILLANEIVTPGKIQRLARVARGAHVTVAVDTADTLPLLGTEAMAAGAIIHVLVDIDVGMGRCGVQSSAAAVALAQRVASTTALSFQGIMGYEGCLRGTPNERAQAFARAVQTLAKAKEAIEAAGLPVSVVSGGGTWTLREHVAAPLLTEIQAGSYVLMEPGLAELGLPFAFAAHVMGTVVSRRAQTAVLDVGRKSVGCDYGPPLVLGTKAQVRSLSEEHTIVIDDSQAPPLGTRVFLQPSQIRTTFNLYDVVHLCRGDVVLDQVPVSARGKSQ
ncbi:MAG: alanine racemase [Anaerolineae bacterium]